MPVIIISWNKEGFFRSTFKFMLKKPPTSFQFSAKAVFIGAICWKFLKNWWSQVEPHDEQNKTLHCNVLWTLKFTWAMFLGCISQIRFCCVKHLGFLELQCLLAHSFIQRGFWVVCQPCVKKQACEEVWPVNQPVRACASVDLLNVVSTLE